MSVRHQYSQSTLGELTYKMADNNVVGEVDQNSVGFFQHNLTAEDAG